MYETVCVLHECIKEYSGLDCLGELGWVSEEGTEFTPGPSIKHVLIMSSFVKERNI